MNDFKVVSMSSSFQLDSSFENSDLSAFPVEPVLGRVTDALSFHDGLACETHRTAEFRDKAGQGLGAAFNYIARHVNPHQLKGMLSNAMSLFFGGALNQNCVICSKAVERNLAALESARIDDFWVAECTTQGGLPQNVSRDHYTSFPLNHEQSLSEQLLQHSQDNSRNIIMVPVRDKGFSHAMNLVRTDMRAIVIDGQFGLLYNLDSPKGRQNFDKHYGPGNSTNVVQVYQTGQAPRSADIDESGWELVEVEDCETGQASTLADIDESDWELVEVGAIGLCSAG
ncbi:hypothetical protein WL48_31045 [Burkholderia ubonensis]|uniref:hypothetical protein n=1 Tax=Burkholderia ubonensis TaxID=101571 RepID=UPI00075CC9A5|nr:hypothetical protein [Burkholderia ubonensis]KWC24491.1 hypothetical protein WL48_31045 [Burkholderia ubonensis]KWC34679.1 hypothetical protein WL49_22500 [Burkholderia ubonensis]